jgi:hypothetical protein
MNLVKKIFLWLFAIVLLIVIQGFMLIYIYENEIKQAAVSKLNDQLNTPIKVGKIELSYFKHFPFLSLRFPDVQIYDSQPEHSNILLAADEISLFFNVWDIYQGKYDVKKLYIENAFWSSVIDKNGNSNFNILKPSTSNNNSKFNLNIQEIIVKNTSVLYIDHQLKQVYKLQIEDLIADGNFNQDNFSLGIKSKTQIQNLNIDGISYIKNKQVSLNTSLFVDYTNKAFQFNNTEIQLEKMKLMFDGLLNYGTKNIQLKVAGIDLDIRSLTSILPSTYSSYFKDYTSTGDVFFNTNINGSYQTNKTPSIILLAGLNNAVLNIKNENSEPININNVNFKIDYKNFGTSSLADDQLNVSNFSGILNSNPITGNVSIKNFQAPLLDIELNTKQSLADVQKIVSIKNVEINSGNIDVQIKLQALLSDLKNNTDYRKINSKGSLKISNAKIRPGKYDYVIDHINGDFNFQNSDLKINDFTFNLGKSDFKLNGYFRNVIYFFLQNDEDLAIDANLTSNYIDLEALLGASANGTADEPYKLKINKRILANLNLQVKHLAISTFHAYDLQGKMEIKDQIVNTDYLAFRSQKGLVFCSLNFNTQQQKRMPMNIKLNLNKVDVSNLFSEFQNFGLNIITDKNLKGQVSANMDVQLVWDENLNTKTEDFSAHGSLLIENGQLLNFEPMMALGKYIDVNELRNLRFSNLANTIDIKNKTITIPDMEVKSNALSMRLAGTHNFDNKIDYHLELLLSDFIKKKSKKLKDEQFGEVEPDGTENTKLYIRMYGDAYNPTFSLDKKIIKKKIAEDFKKERAEVKQILKDEFGSWFKKEKEFKENITEEAQEWEKDIPQQKLQNKSVSSTNKTDSLGNKTKLQKLKEKLKEKPDPEDE